MAVYGKAKFDFYFRTLRPEKKTTMNTERLRTIGIEEFKLGPHLIDYVDENIIILDNLDISASKDECIKLNCFLIALCIEGSIPVQINGKGYLLKANQCAFILPNAVVRKVKETKCKIRIIAFNSRFFKGIPNMKQESWDVLTYLHEHPIFPINRSTSYKFYLYKELILNCIDERPHPFIKESKHHLFSAIIYEMLAKLYEDIPLTSTTQIQNDRSTQIFRRFVEKVTEDNGTHRSVAYYADQLCYSSKYLSTVIKKVCGRAPLALINEHAMEQIKFQLRHSDMSMKELADYFDFANPSFFGKFVKQHLGMSPMQYRTQKEE